MRDKKRPASYFNEKIQAERNGIKLYVPYFNKGGEGMLTKEVAADSIVMFYLKIIIATYSKGDVELKTTLNDLLPFIEFIEFEDSYVEALWILSIAYILEMEPEKLESLRQRILENEYNDFVVSTILNAIFPEEKINNNFVWKRPYSVLEPVLSQREEADIRVVESYLRKDWYKGHNDCSWHDTHKRDNLSYAGYWAFETAALVKLFGLDDSSLQGLDYYPYDLVHFDDRTRIG